MTPAAEPQRAGIPAVTLHQPWASLIMAGPKRYETRSWAPPLRHVGKTLAIHAGQRLETRLPPEVVDTLVALFGKDWKHELPRGAVLGTVRLAGAWRTGDPTGRVSLHGHPICALTEAVAGSAHRSEADTDTYGDFLPGRWIWEMADVRAATIPVAASGLQRVWYWKGDEADLQDRS